MQEQEKSIFQKEIKLFPPRFNAKRKYALYNELSILINAGVDAYNALQVVANQEENKQLNQKFQNALVGLTQGDEFSLSLKKNLTLTEYEYFSLKIGEESGNLGVILNDLATYFQNQLAQKRKFVKALTYPVLIIIVSFFVITFMLGF